MMDYAAPKRPPTGKASPFPGFPWTLGLDVVALHVSFEFLRVDVNVLLEKGIEETVVAESRVPLVQPFDLVGDAFVDGVVMAGRHRKNRSFPPPRAPPPAPTRPGKLRGPTRSFPSDLAFRP